jgi:hypothetical protein
MEHTDAMELSLLGVGVLLFLCIVYVLVSRRQFELWKAPFYATLLGLFASLMCYYQTGELLVRWEFISGPWKVAIQAAGSWAVFVLVFRDVLSYYSSTFKPGSGGGPDRIDGKEDGKANRRTRRWEEIIYKVIRRRETEEWEEEEKESDCLGELFGPRRRRFVELATHMRWFGYGIVEFGRASVVTAIPTQTPKSSCFSVDRGHGSVYAWKPLWKRSTHRVRPKRLRVVKAHEHPRMSRAELPYLLNIDDFGIIGLHLEITDAVDVVDKVSTSGLRSEGPFGIERPIAISSFAPIHALFGPQQSLACLAGSTLSAVMSELPMRYDIADCHVVSSDKEQGLERLRENLEYLWTEREDEGTKGEPIGSAQFRSPAEGNDQNRPSPGAIGDTEITMTATTGSDASPPVEYYFDETSGNPGGTDSGWVTNLVYNDTGLQADTTYTYAVEMRDSLCNTGTASVPANATADSVPDNDPATFASAPAAISDTEITMTATTGSDASRPLEYYFDETSGNPEWTDSGWTTNSVYTDSGLDPVTQYAYTVQMRDSLANTGTASGPANGTTPDIGAQTPDPAVFASSPAAVNDTEITMTGTSSSLELAASIA